MTTAFQKVYTKITQITKATCTLNAQGVGNDELAIGMRTLLAGMSVISFVLRSMLM